MPNFSCCVCLYSNGNTSLGHCLYTNKALGTTPSITSKRDSDFHNLQSISQIHWEEKDKKEAFLGQLLIYSSLPLFTLSLPTCWRGNLTATSRLFCLLPVALVASLALCFGLPEQPVEEALQAWTNSAEEYTWFSVTAHKIQGSGTLIVQWGRGVESNSVHLSASLEPSEKPP